MNDKNRNKYLTIQSRQGRYCSCESIFLVAIEHTWLVSVFSIVIVSLNYRWPIISVFVRVGDLIAFIVALQYV